jgi:hypothetical protein
MDSKKMCEVTPVTFPEEWHVYIAPFPVEEERKKI